MHVMGKKHLHYTPKKISVIGRFDVNNVDMVHDYFGLYGTIGTKKVTAERGKVTIDYSFHDTRAHSKIIYKDHYLFEQKLKIKWDQIIMPLPPLPYTLNNQKKFPTPVKPKLGGIHKRMKFDSESTKQAILNGVKEVETFTDQLTLLHDKLQVDKVHNERKKKLISNDLTTALSPMFALNKIYFFGSSVTDLDMHGSDLDIYIANVRENANIKPEVSSLKLMRHLIFKSRKFCDILLIANAKIPIIKCIHTKTNMCCDLNIRNKMSVCNSQLIRYYLSLDEKMRPLMIVIKFWADCYDLKRVNFFSSYALYMLVIFYLQHEPYRVPSVMELQKNIAPDLVDGWNCAFELKGFSSPALRNDSLPNLIAGFFKFYSNFDYFSQIIAPYYGSAVDKTCFVDPTDLPDGYKEYQNHRQSLAATFGICIQDPFEHARNVAASVSLNCTAKFVTMCRTSLKLIQTAEDELLYKVLTQKQSLDYVFELEKPGDKDEEDWRAAVRDMACKVVNGILNMTTVRSKDTDYYTCNGGYSIWEERINVIKKLLKTFPADMSEIDREIAATKYIIKYLTQTLSFGFSMNMNFKQKPCTVEFTLHPTSKKCKTFLHVSHFFAMRLNRFLTAEGNSTSATSIDIEAALADVFSSTRPHSGDMTHHDDKISEDTKGRDTSPGKNVRVNQTNDDRTNGGETSKSDEEKTNIGEAEEEEDIPADFFDDFSNQDFMDGLDIVDAWDEDKLLDESDRTSKERERERLRRTHSPIRFGSKSPARRRRQARSRSKSLVKRYKRSSTHSQKGFRSRSYDKTRLNERRDPEKTKRDINNDKIKCAKDKEQKIVDDKLRIVETGLVPPGTEMETDVGAILRAKEKEKKRSTTGGSMEKMRDSKPERERERRHFKRSISRESRKPPRHSPNPPPYRTRPRESVYRSRKRTPSLDSNLSDRELWIRAGRKRSRSRSRSRESILRRAKNKKYDEEKKKKKSFLEEIRDKLNETRTPLPPVAAPPAPYNMPQYPNHGMSHPIPAPVPAPQFFQNPPMHQQYDQSFFIGDGFSQHGMMNQPRPPVNFGMAGNPGNVLHLPMPVQVQPPAPSPVQVRVPPAPGQKPQGMVSPKINLLSEVTVRQKVEEKKDGVREAIEDISKLFADKKISLTDFLTITAKCEDLSSNPEHLQKKIKVISRCQDAIKTMSEDSKFNGRLCVKPSPEQRSKTDVQYQSPLRRIPLVRFQFTTPAKVSDDSDNFTLALDKILQKIGLLKETNDLDESCETSRSRLSYSSFADEEAATLTMKAAFLNAKKTETKSECEECRKRKAKTFAEVGSQCADDDKNAVTVATQVTEEDLSINKPKNDSIAYLTPAQLLGKEKEEEEQQQKQPTPVKTTEPSLGTPPSRRGKPKPSPFKSRGAARKPHRGRPVFNKHTDYEYRYEDQLDFYDRPAFEAQHEDFERPFGGPSGAPRFPRQYGEDDPRMHPFRDDDVNFTDFTHPYRGRGGHFGPRF